ncbi:glutamine-hydrolyzing carbamoyl-phosphate synthase small subunit [Candidatus Micrarchaeota archaeon]|nr:glutamine-hydrolyzing carbamoyl-phosphate synthase small subunit [Candidatus Micrarchaeota archaeon]
MKNAVGLLVFSDGSYLQGQGIGYPRTSIGELVFNTSMTGYQEALTDPSYAGQVLVFSYPLIGNYGISPKAFESSKSWVEGVIVSQACEKPQHYDSGTDLNDFLRAQRVPGIAGLDTRALVQKIRVGGVKPVALDIIDEDLVDTHVKRLQKKALGFDYEKENFVARVSRTKIQSYSPMEPKQAVVLVDCGAKQSIVRDLLQRNCRVHVVPYNASASSILKLKPDGVMFSNGPGDPEQLKQTVSACKDLLGKVPVFGICLGHQILGQALGAKTFKLKFGHRGANHAVQDVRTGKIWITSQNHGYAVHQIPAKAEEWLKNCLDGTNEGLLCDKYNAFSVQFHPEANPGPYDANALFDEFLERMS